MDILYKKIISLYFNELLRISTLTRKRNVPIIFTYRIVFV
jgi:hypothetical protein